MLKRRLFERVDVPQETVDAYCHLWTQYRDRIDASHQGAEARTALAASYPFHPDLLDTLTGKTATFRPAADRPLHANWIVHSIQVFRVTHVMPIGGGMKWVLYPTRPT